MCSGQELSGRSASQLQMAVVAFVVLQLKEWVDARAFDTPAVIVDSAYVAGGTFALDAILMLAKS